MLGYQQSRIVSIYFIYKFYATVSCSRLNAPTSPSPARLWRTATNHKPRTEWPSTLKVEVVEEVPIARLGKQGFLNRLGDQLEIADNSNLGSLPVLRAEFGSTQDMIQQYQLLAELLIPTSLKLTELQRDSVGAWQAATDPGIRLILGRDEIAEKIRRLVIVWQSGLSLQSDNIKTIDLRYPNGLAVSWKESALADSKDQVLLNKVSNSA